MPPARVISTRFPYIPITVTVQGRSEEVEALFDTGFDGFVIVPLDLVTNGGPPDARLQYVLADNSVIVAPAYRGTVQIGSFGPYRVVVSILGDQPIVGRQLMQRFTVTLEHGDRVIVEP